MNILKSSIVTLSILLASGAAQAGLITLDQWNSTELQASGDSVQLSWVDGGNTLSIQWVDGAPADLVSPVGLDKVGFNYNGSLTFVSGTAGWGIAPGGSNISDFGSFDFRYKEPASNDGIGSAIELTFSEQLFDANFYANTDGNIGVAHVRYDNDCSGFVGDGGPGATVSSNQACGGPTPTTNVPEPGSLVLLGLGLMGLAYSRKRAC